MVNRPEALFLRLFDGDQNFIVLRAYSLRQWSCQGEGGRGVRELEEASLNQLSGCFPIPLAKGFSWLLTILPHTHLFSNQILFYTPSAKRKAWGVRLEWDSGLEEREGFGHQSDVRKNSSSDSPCHVTISKLLNLTDLISSFIKWGR